MANVTGQRDRLVGPQNDLLAEPGPQEISQIRAETGGAPKRGTNAYKTWVVNAVRKHPHQRTPEEQAAIEHEMDLAYRKHEHPGVRRAFEMESPHFGAQFSPLGGDGDQPFERSAAPCFGGRPRRLIGAVDD